MPTDWIIPIRTSNGAFANLICFHFAGSSGYIFRSWSKLINENYNVYAIQLPGRDGRSKEPFMTNSLAIANEIVEAIQQYIDLPFCFFGHSVGALLCYEVARVLKLRKMKAPFRLMVSGRRSPVVKQTYLNMNNLPKEELIEQLREFGGTPSNILDNPDLIQYFLPRIRADLAIGETHVYTQEPLLEMPINAFIGEHDIAAPYHEMKEWHRQTNGSFEIMHFTGSHFFIISNQHNVISCVNQLLKSDMESVRECERV